ncbi:MAG: hypothetical protein AB7F89_15165 [Pirellulaceae bacterium]
MSSTVELQPSKATHLAAVPEVTFANTSAELALERERLEHEVRIEEERDKAAELARLRELARFD